eukprot:9246545-Alexandrium_andersonii.AAC.1
MPFGSPLGVALMGQLRAVGEKQSRLAVTCARVLCTASPAWFEACALAGLLRQQGGRAGCMVQHVRGFQRKVGTQRRIQGQRGG